LKKTVENLTLLKCIFVTSLIIANIAAAKVVSFWGLVVPAAIVAYPLTFLMTDVIGEIWGKEEANRTVKLGFMCQLISLVLIGLAILLPVAEFANNQAEFKSILGQSFRVVGASMIAYLVAQFNDVFIFHKLKEKCNGKHKWLRNNISTLTSQLFDTAIFITVAFIGTVPNIFVMIISQYVVKAVYALLDTPFFYLLTKKSKSKYDNGYNQNLEEVRAKYHE
jgi:uncharacterized integral membrane protein (TIGR00697 family)